MSAPATCWKVTLLVTAPAAKTISFRFREEPEHREIENLMIREGAVSATVYPPTNPND